MLLDCQVRCAVWTLLGWAYLTHAGTYARVRGAQLWSTAQHSYTRTRSCWEHGWDVLS